MIFKLINFFLKPFKDLLTDSSLTLGTVFFSILVILLPVALITGPAIPDVFLSILALYFLIFSIIKKLWHYYLNPIFIGTIVFCVYGILRSYFSEYPVESLTNEGSVFYFRYIFFSTTIWYLLENNPYLSKCLLNIILICLFIVITDGIYQYFNEVNLFGNEKYDINRLTGLFGDEPIIGRYISYMAIFAFFLIYQIFKLNSLTIILSVFLLIAAEVTVFLTGERAPLFNIALFSIFLLIFVPSFRIYRVIGVFISIFIIFIITIFNPISKERVFVQTINEISETHLPFLPYTELHEQHYVAALKMFKERPLVGVGTNLFRYQCEKEKYRYKDRSCTSHPHNYYFQLLAELGLLGFLFLVCFFIYLSFKMLKQFWYLLKSNSKMLIKFDNFLLIIIPFIFYWPLIPHMSFYNNWNNIFIMLPIGYLLRFFYGKR